jgi:hypothetical protein
MFASCDGLLLGKAFVSCEGLRPAEFSTEGRLEWLWFCGGANSCGGADIDRPICAASLDCAGGGGVYTVDGSNSGISSSLRSSATGSALFGDSLLGD